MIKPYLNAHRLPEAWVVLNIAIPRGKAEAIGAYIGRSAGTVRKWREPNEHGSGEPSFLDGLFAVADALSLCDEEEGLRKLEASITCFFDGLHNRSRGDHAEFNANLAAAAVSKESHEFVAAVLGGKTAKEQRRELIEAIAVLQAQLARLDGDLGRKRLR